MLISIATLKSFLGLPEDDNATIDPILERSSLMAQNLVGAYIGMPPEAVDDEYVTYDRDNMRDVRVIRLPLYPGRLLSFKIDNVEVPADQYIFNKRLGVVSMYSGRTAVKQLSIQYFPGWDNETLLLPADMETAMVNIALGLYANGGAVQTGSTGALKSLTMFDAMSMSFDVGAGSTVAESSTPEGIVKQWAFTLDKYKVDSFVMA